MNETSNLPENNETGSMRNAVSKYLDQTSVPGVPQLSKTSNPLRRILWIIFLVAGLTMAIYQSSHLIQGYKKYLTLITATEEMNSTLMIPAITFCPQIAILWNKIHHLNHWTYKAILERNVFGEAQDWENLTLRETYDRRFRNTNNIQEIVLQLNDTEREVVLPQLREVIIMAEDQKQFYTDDEIYIPAYGKCFTFNPGLPGYPEPIHIKSSNYLIFNLYLDEKQRTPFTMFGNRWLVNIHAPGTAPELSSGIIVNLETKQKLFASVALKKIHRLPAPYRSACTNENTPKNRKRNAYYSPERPYLYTRRACRQKKYQDLLKAKFHCHHAELPINGNASSLCTDDEINSVKDIRSGCNLSCNELKYDWTPIITEFSMDVGFNRDIATHMYKQFQAIQTMRKGTTLKEFKNGLSRVILTIKSVVYESISEQPKYTISDILGAIGGNIGLWVGISIVSFIELFELILLLIMKFFRAAVRKCFKKFRKP